MSDTPRVLRVTANGNAVPRYCKFEVTLEIDRPFAPDSFLPYYYFDANDPTGKEGISIDAEFKTPSGATLLAPAFYFCGQKRRLNFRGRVRVEPTGERGWKIRFAPRETGVYEYRIVVRDCHGVTVYPEKGALSFTCVPSESRGFVRVSPRDPRFFEFESGESFVPISAGQQWWATRGGLRSVHYERAFETFHAHGINFTRLWDQCDGWALTVEGPFDAYEGFGSRTGNPEGYGPEGERPGRIAGFRRGTQMNQRSNFEQDLILEAAERNGVYLQLCSVGDPKWIWDASVHDTSRGPIDWNPRRVPFDDAAHLSYWKRNFRYRAARWGYSTALVAWEAWNEHDAVEIGSDVHRFYQEYGEYQRATDLHGHLRTTSQGSRIRSGGFWSSPAFDIANYHDYMMPSRYDDEMAHDAALFVYRLAQSLRMRRAPRGTFDGGDSEWEGAPTPIVWGECDTGTTRWNEANPQWRATHAAMWAGLFSPLGMAPIDWYWEEQPYLQEKYARCKIAADFFRDVDYAGGGMEYLATDDVRVTSERIETAHPDLRALAMRGGAGDAAYAWVQHRATRRYDGADTGEPLDAQFILPRMKAGAYCVEVWDTYAGGVECGELATDATGALVVPVKGLTRDAAVKAVRRTGDGSQ